MPQLKERLPKDRLHRASGQAVITLNAKDCYPGRYDTPASRKKFDRLIAEWLASGRQLNDHAAMIADRHSNAMVSNPFPRSFDAALTELPIRRSAIPTRTRGLNCSIVTVSFKARNSDANESL